MTIALRISLALFAVLPCTTALAAEPNAVTITTTKFEVTGNALELRYQITNGSNDDVWLCEDIGVNRSGFEVYLTEDEATLMVRSRASASSSIRSFDRFLSCSVDYVRLRAGESRTGSLLLPLPIRYQNSFAEIGLRHSERITHARRLIVEIGFYSKDPFAASVASHAQQDEAHGDPRHKSDAFHGLFYLLRMNEYVKDRDERSRIDVTASCLKGEKVLRLTIDGKHIPCVGKPLHPGPHPPFIKEGMLVEITYRPSMLEYFFPSVSQQSLLSPAEKEYLQSSMTTTVNDWAQLKPLGREIALGWFGPIVAAGGAAHINCDQDGQRSLSFDIHSRGMIASDDEQGFICGEGFPSLARLTPQVWSLELRLQCAAHLKNLAHRMAWYGAVRDAAEETLYAQTLPESYVPTYPAPMQWCDQMMCAYERIPVLGSQDVVKSHVCPSATEGKCHYAMNPHCEADSAGNMVLLFETKGGWNQHGGAELFTFDNHDPKGGCVLLNDGTVKFIRTEAELGALRWE